MEQSCLCCCTAWRPGLSLEPSPSGLTALTVGLLDRFLASTGATSSPMKRCGALAGQIPASSLAARRRVRRYGHVLRMPPHHPSQAILDFDPASFDWKRPGGTPRTRWIDVVRRDLDRFGLNPGAIEANKCTMIRCCKPARCCTAWRCCLEPEKLSCDHAISADIDRHHVTRKCRLCTQGRLADARPYCEVPLPRTMIPM